MPFKGGKDGGGTVSRIHRIGPQLIADQSGALYGTTLLGGAGTVCCGTIFKLAPPASGQTTWTKTTLHVFGGPPDGLSPVGALTLGAKGTLFGVTVSGGSNANCDPQYKPIRHRAVAARFSNLFPVGGTNRLDRCGDYPIGQYGISLFDLVPYKGALYGTAQVSTDTGSKG